MKTQSLKKYERIRRKNDFKRVYEQGKRLSSSSLTLYLYQSHTRQYCRLGITASKKVGNAVKRNRCKRIVREVFRRNKNLFPQGTDVVVIVKPDMVNKQYAEVMEELCSILQT